VIELKDVSCRFAGRVLFEGVHLSIRRGEIALLRGKSGCGKTTFLRILSAFLDPTTGRLELDGKPYRSYRYPELRSKIVYLHQTPVLEAGKSVRENLLAPFSLAAHKGKPTPKEETILPLLAAFHLDRSLLPRDARELSVGEQQRVAILRAYLLQPDYLLLDEPIANLDAESARAIRTWLSGATLDRAGLVISSHQEMEDLPANRIRRLEFAEGSILERSS
jgi:ABC-type multidrug transport system ATPase subunit